MARRVVGCVVQFMDGKPIAIAKPLGIDHLILLEA